MRKLRVTILAARLFAAASALAVAMVIGGDEFFVVARAAFRAAEADGGIDEELGRLLRSYRP